MASAPGPLDLSRTTKRWYVSERPEVVPSPLPAEILQRISCEQRCQDAAMLRVSLHAPFGCDNTRPRICEWHCFVMFARVRWTVIAAEYGSCRVGAYGRLSEWGSRENPTATPRSSAPLLAFPDSKLTISGAWRLSKTREPRGRVSPHVLVSEKTKRRQAPTFPGHDPPL